MKTTQKLLIIFLAFLMSFLPACITMHESASSKPKISVTEATNSIKEAIKDTNTRYGCNIVADVAISEKGITFFHDDNTKRYFAFSNIPEPKAMIDNTFAMNDNRVALKYGFFDYYNISFNNAKSATMFADALYYLKHQDDPDVKKERESENEDCLRLVRQTPIDLILAGTTADGLNLPCSAVPKAQIESILNEKLVEWKSKGLGERLQKSSSVQLSDLVVKMEKGILKLDLKAKELKDAADEDARKVQAPGQAAPAKTAPEGALATARLLDQRKTILGVIVGWVRQAAAQRASGG